MNRQSQEPSSPPSEATSAPAPEILVIEDNADVREGLRELLESCGYTVDVAEDGLEGVERALALRPRIALVDLGLPRLDGFGVAERLRSVLPRSEIALVALTGWTQPEDLRRIVATGFDEYMSKPVSFEKLEALLTARLAGSRKTTPGG